MFVNVIMHPINKLTSVACQVALLAGHKLIAREVLRSGLSMGGLEIDDSLQAVLAGGSHSISN